MTDPLDDTDLARLLAGDTAAWRECVRRAGPSLHGAVLRVLAPAGRAADGPDIVQETLLHLCRDDYRVLRTFDSGRGRFSTWLRAVAVRAALDHLRKASTGEHPVAQIPEAAQPTDPGPSPGALAALTLPPDLLSPQQHLILRMCYEDGREIEEIARLLNLEAQTVRSQRHKALARLREFAGTRNFF